MWVRPPPSANADNIRCVISTYIQSYLICQTTDERRREVLTKGFGSAIRLAAPNYPYWPWVLMAAKGSR